MPQTKPRSQTKAAVEPVAEEAKPVAGHELFIPVHTPDELHAWVLKHIGINIPRRAVCPHHCAPFDYLRKAYFEPAEDLIVWAPRGGGKTRLAAIATFLDLMHKPGIAVKILGGSKLQSLRMWDHLWPSVAEKIWGQLSGRLVSGRVRLRNGSHAEAIAHSERAVRGMHVQKLRCDELELFDPAVFEAAQLTTRSLTMDNGAVVRGSIEALSTLHAPWGLMHRTIEAATAAGRPVIKWCVLDVLQRCPPERECATCPLWDDCQGLAKQADGFLPIDDAIRAKHRVSRECWEAEMLCKRPNVKGAVFPTFELDAHVSETVRFAGEKPRVSLAIDFGFANPFVCLWIADDGHHVHVIDEYVQSGRTMEEHLAWIESRPHGSVRSVACDPAGNSRNDQTAESNVQLLKRRGYTIRTRRSLIVDGLEKVRHALRTGAGERSLWIHPRCVNLIRAMRGYHYPPDFNSELPVKDGEHDHLIDALRYFYVNRVGKMAKEGLVSRQY